MNQKAAPHPLHSFLGKDSKKLFIAGKWVDAVSGETFECFNPATGAVIARVAKRGPEDIDRAVIAARKAFEGPWSAVKPFDRQNLLLAIADGIDRRFDELSLLEALDMGAPLARTSLFKRWMLQSFRYFAAQSVSITGMSWRTHFLANISATLSRIRSELSAGSSRGMDRSRQDHLDQSPLTDDSLA